MKAFLMHRDEDFDTRSELPGNEPALTQDLELNTLLGAMAGNDPLLFEVAKRALLLSLHDPAAITYRQEILTDCLATPSVIRDLYQLAGEALQAEKSVWGSLLEREAPHMLLHTSVRKMEILVAFLRRLREAADEHASSFRSPGLTRFFAMLIDELNDEYFDLIEGYLKELNFKGGMLISAQLTTGNKGSSYMLRRAREQGFISRMLDRSGYGFTVPERDEAGFRALGELQDKGANLVAHALAQSVDHVLSFFITLRTEIGFYVGGLNLSDRLAAKQEPTTLPTIVGHDQIRAERQRLHRQQALAFAAAQLVRIGLMKARAIEAHQRQELSRPSRGSGQLGDLLAGRQEWGEAGKRLLRDITSPAANCATAGNRRAGGQQPHGSLQQGRLAAPGLAGDTQPSTGFQGDRHGIKYLLPLRIPDAQVAQIDEGHVPKITKCRPKLPAVSCGLLPLCRYTHLTFWITSKSADARAMATPKT